MKNRLRGVVFLGVILFSVSLLCNAVAAVEEGTFKKEGQREIMKVTGKWGFLSLPGPDAKLVFPPEGNWQEVEGTSNYIYPISWTGGKDRLAFWYKKKVYLPASLSGKRIKVKFHAVAWTSHIYFNGKKIGVNKDGFLPFEFDVTDVARLDAENELLLGGEDWQTLVDDKGKRLYPLGPTGDWFIGIWQPVEIIAYPEVYVKDVFVKTSTRKKSIGLEITLKNEGSIPHSITVSSEVLDRRYQDNPNPTSFDDLKIEKDITVKTFAAKTLSLASGEEQVIAIEESWHDPVFWAPDNPHLYNLKTSLKEGNSDVDTTTTRFGFREVWTEGPDIYLNGAKIRLKGVWAHIGEILGLGLGQREGWELLKKYNYTWVRLHAVVYPPAVLDAADEAGMLVADETALYQHYQWPCEGALEHTKKWVIRDRNHPSVIFWDGSNEENFRLPEVVKLLKEQEKLILSLDPTRLIFQSAAADIMPGEMVYSWHYPESQAHQWTLFPNKFYWPIDKNIPTSYTREHGWALPSAAIGFDWKKDKPILATEQSWDVASPFALGGDKCFQDEPTGRNDVPFCFGGYWHSVCDIAEMAMEAYRYCNVAGETGGSGMFAYPNHRISYPYLERFKQIYAPLGVYLKEYEHLFFEGDKIEKTIVSYNETLEQQKLVLNYKVTRGKEVVKSGEYSLMITPGEIDVKKIDFLAPQVKEREKLHLELSLLSNGDQKASSIYEFSVFPRRKLSLDKTSRMALFDPIGQTANIMKKEGVNFQVITDLEYLDKIKDKTDILLIGYHAFVKDAALGRAPGIIGEFVKNGGCVFIFEQDSMPNFMPVTLAPVPVDKSPAATVVFPLAKAHPLLAGLKEDDLKFWGADNIVVSNIFYLPEAGNFITVADSWAGMFTPDVRTPLLEIPYGKGSYVISQLNITEKFDEVPVAHLLLENVLNYLSEQPIVQERKTVIYSVGLYQMMTEQFKVKAASLDKVENIKGFECLITDGAQLKTMKPAEIEIIKEFVKDGGSMLIHDLIPEAVANATQLLGLDIGLEPAKDIGAVIIKPDVITSGLSSYSTAWEKAGVLSDERIKFILKVKDEENVKILSEPAGLVKVSSGKGYYLINQFAFDKYLSDKKEKAQVFGLTLFTDLGVPIKGRSLIAVKEKGYFAVDLSSHCNVGFEQPDQEWEEMSYSFETDKLKSKSKIMEEYYGKWINVVIPLNKYMGKQRFNDIPFKIIDPKENNGRGCIVLTNTKDGRQSNRLNLEKAEGISVNKKVSVLYFFHSAMRNYLESGGNIGAYVVNYKDNMKIKIPLREEKELSMWWADPKDLPNAKIALKVDHPHPYVPKPFQPGVPTSSSKLGFWDMKWENPYPEGTVESIDFVSSGETCGYSPVLVAITGMEIE